MEAKIKLDWYDMSALLQMLKAGIEYHRTMSLEGRNTIDGIQDVVCADAFEKLYEEIATKAKKSERKQHVNITFTIKNDVCFALIKGRLIVNNNDFEYGVYAKVYKVIQQAVYTSQAFYSSQMEISNTKLLQA